MHARGMEHIECEDDVCADTKIKKKINDYCILAMPHHADVVVFVYAWLDCSQERWLPANLRHDWLCAVHTVLNDENRNAICLPLRSSIVFNFSVEANFREHTARFTRIGNEKQNTTTEMKNDDVMTMDKVNDANFSTTHHHQFVLCCCCCWLVWSLNHFGRFSSFSVFILITTHWANTEHVEFIIYSLMKTQKRTNRNVIQYNVRAFGRMREWYVLQTN